MERDRGISTPIEMMALTTLCLVAFVFIGFLGRLHSTGIETTSVARAAAREASMALTPTAAANVAARVVSTSSLARRCSSLRPTFEWARSVEGSWRGGSVTVTVTCVVRAASLTGVWVPGVRTVTAHDTQPVDRYQR
jgi:hypothetical protein